MKKLIFFILLALSPALASAEIEINNIVNGEIIVLKTETVYADGTDCKIVAVEVPALNVATVEIVCFKPVVEGGGGGGGDTNSNNTTTTNNEDNDTYYEDNDTYNTSTATTTENNDYDYSETNTKQNGATVNMNR